MALYKKQKPKIYKTDDQIVGNTNSPHTFQQPVPERNIDFINAKPTPANYNEFVLTALQELSNQSNIVGANLPVINKEIATERYIKPIFLGTPNSPTEEFLYSNPTSTLNFETNTDCEQVFLFANIQAKKSDRGFNKISDKVDSNIPNPITTQLPSDTANKYQLVFLEQTEKDSKIKINSYDFFVKNAGKGVGTVVQSPIQVDTWYNTKYVGGKPDGRSSRWVDYNIGDNVTVGATNDTITTREIGERFDWSFGSIFLAKTFGSTTRNPDETYREIKYTFDPDNNCITLSDWDFVIQDSPTTYSDRYTTKVKLISDTVIEETEELTKEEVTAGVVGRKIFTYLIKAFEEGECIRIEEVYGGIKINVDFNYNGRCCEQPIISSSSSSSETACFSLYPSNVNQYEQDDGKICICFRGNDEETGYVEICNEVIPVSTKNGILSWNYGTVNEYNFTYFKECKTFYTNTGCEYEVCFTEFNPPCFTMEFIGVFNVSSSSTSLSSTSSSSKSSLSSRSTSSSSSSSSSSRSTSSSSSSSSSSRSTSSSSSSSSSSRSTSSSSNSSSSTSSSSQPIGSSSSSSFSEIIYALGAPNNTAIMGLGTFIKAGPAPSVLDFVPNAVAAYSLRLLNSNYNGPLVTLRRTSDNATSSFFADKFGNISLNSLNSGNVSLGVWNQNSNVTIITWYDQSGNTNNATQPTNAYQPLLMSAGSIYNINGKPAINFDGTTNFNLSRVIDTDWTFNTVIKTSQLTTNTPWFNYTGLLGGETWANVSDFGIGLYAGRLAVGTGNPEQSAYANTANNVNSSVVLINTRNSSTGEVVFRRNGVPDGSSSLTTGIRSAPLILSIGKMASYIPVYDPGCGYFVGYMSEMILYSSIKNNTELTTIENNQISFYDAFVPFEIIPNNPGARLWGTIAVDYVGDNIVVGEYGSWGSPGVVFTSSNRGTNMTDRGYPGPSSYLGSSCSSFDNSIVYMGTDAFTGIFKSIDYGATWSTTSAPAEHWYDMCCTPDGDIVYAAGWGGHIIKSDNYGVSWAQNDAVDSWTTICCSDDGNTVYAGTTDGRIFKSINSGGIFTQIASLPSPHGMMACSNDGIKLITTSGGAGGIIQLSDNGGESWYTVGGIGNWNRCRSSRDGQVLIASQYGGYIYVSKDRGLNWIIGDVAGSWQAIRMNSTGSKMYGLSWGVGIYRNIML